ncbi:MAG: DNA polymerase I [Gammaproteobacteria bacterium]|nr:MAG: DNA polymerase I [Gammaproteobacteria bacterium]TLZ40944.1 MAG: DNA polymerase I [Gammaproteobacteria bacterium]
MTRSPDLVLVDGSSYVYRAFHALPPLSNSRGEPTGAVLGVLNMLLKFLKDYQPRRIAVVFDAPGKTFRDELFTEYKAHRPSMPDDLRAQIGPLLEIIEAQGLPLLRVPGVEADDVIGTLARRAAQAGQTVLISTGDKDMAQLVDGSITLVNTMNNTVLDRDAVKAKFDVYPEQIVDYLALVGDSSDNIPGIDKVGPKTGARLLQQYGGLDELIGHVAEVPGKVGENLRTGLTTLELSRRLATIRTDLTLPLSVEELVPGPPDSARLRELYTRYELRALLRQLEGADAMAGGAATPVAHSPQPLPAVPGAGTAAAAPPAAAPSGASPAPADIARRYETVTRWEDLERWLAAVRTAELFAFDTETTSLDYMRAEIVGVSLCIEPGVAAYVPLRHVYPGAPEQLDRERVLAALKPILEDPARGKVGHNLKYDAHVLANAGIRLAGMRFDSMLESYVWNSVATNHDMDADAQRYLGLRTITYEDVAGKGAKQLSFDQVPLERAGDYAAEDADVTLRLHGALWPQLEAVPALARLYLECEQPLVPVLFAMEHRGVLVDRERLRTQSREFARQLQELLLQAHREAGHEFNIESPKQLQQILFERLQLPVRRKTPTGQPSTAEDVLEELAGSYTLPRIVLEYRALAKLKSTYTDTLPEQVNERTGRIHTNYAQAVAATGRLSSVDPNLQNIPVRRPEGRRIRQAFIAPPGYLLLAADYSQIELRIMAHLSGDESLRAAFAADRDVHQATAAEVFGVGLDAVTPDQRRTAKVINFGLIYGMSAFGLARNLGIERGAAQQYVERYFQRYPGVKRFMDETRAQARQIGYVETVFGRRLYLPDIRSGNTQLRQYAERSAINAPMQGTAADIIKRAMITIDAWCTAEDAPARLIMQVHDELVLEVREDAVQQASAAVRERMVNAASLSVPLRVDVGVGANWDEAH